MMTILPEFAKQYQEYINLGKKYIKNQNIIIIGLVRDCEKYIQDNILSINNIRNYCKNLSYFIYENDSTDNSKNILESIQSEVQNFQYQSDILNDKGFKHGQDDDLKSTERTNNLSKYRNICLDFIKKNSCLYDYVIIMDMDFNKFSLDGIINSFGWFSVDYADALVGNSFQLKINPTINHQILWNYDCWAYRGNWWEDLQKYANIYHNDPMLWFGFWQPPIGSNPIPVNSAFGGIGIYKTQDYIRVNYEGYDCEHVCLHKQLKTQNPKYRLCLNPSQIMLLE